MRPTTPEVLQPVDSIVPPTRRRTRASLEDADGREYRPTTLVVLGGSFRHCPQPGHSVLKPGRVLFQGDVAKDPVYWKAGA